jgi:membrane protein required for colicin V production
MTQFDFIAGPLLIVSALIGFGRGATKELMTVVAFLVAAITAVFSLRFTAPIGRSIVEPDWAGVGIALLFVFGLTYIALRLLGAGLQRRQVRGDRSVVDVRAGRLADGGGSHDGGGVCGGWGGVGV